MTEIKLPYGREAKTLHMPPEVAVDFLTPEKAPPIDNVTEALLSACKSPVGGPTLEEMVRAGGNVVILVSDLTRSKGAEVVLPLCIEHLKDLGIDPISIKILIARGTHRKLSRSEKDFFRKGAIAGVTFEEHNCDDPEKLSALLLTHRGTPVRVNLALKDAGLVIILAPVSYHYFAGFGGGRKLVLPGCADRQAILANHRLSLVDERPVKLHPNCKSGVLEGNPVHEDMIETLAALQRIFAINFFADADGKLAFLNAGDPVRSHEEACGRYAEIHDYPLAERYDVAILSAGGYPYDINFLQSHKPLRHVAGAVNEGGTVLYYAECSEGVGSESLGAALAVEKSKYLKQAHKQYDLNNQTAVSLLELAGRFEVGMVSEMNVDFLLSCGIKPCVNAETFLAEALEKHDAKKIAVITNGNSLLPRLSPGGK